MEQENNHAEHECPFTDVELLNMAAKQHPSELWDKAFGFYNKHRNKEWRPLSMNCRPCFGTVLSFILSYRFNITEGRDDSSHIHLPQDSKDINISEVAFGLPKEDKTILDRLKIIEHEIGILNKRISSLEETSIILRTDIRAIQAKSRISLDDFES